MATFNGTNKASFYAYLRMEVWENSKNVASNLTNIGYKISLVSSNGWPYASGGSYPWSIQEGGVVRASGSISSYNVPAGGTFQIATGNFNVTHNNDGKKTGSFYSSFTGYHGTVDVSGSMALSTIPRASTPTLSASTVNYGVSVTINTNRLSTGFTHNMRAIFSGEAVTIGSGYTTSATWTVPLTMMNKIPNATSSFCTIYVDTYSGTTLIGTKTVVLNTTVPSTIVPTISSQTHTEAVSGLFANIGGYVQSLSKIRATLGGAGTYGSTITSYEITIDGKRYGGSDVTSNVITSSGSSTISYKITDSRGRTATGTNAITILAYSQPNLTSFSVARKVGDTTTLQVNRSGTFSHLTAKNTGTIVVYTKLKTTTDWGTAKDTITSTTGAIGGTIELTGHSDELSYDIKVVFYDEFTSANPSTATLSVSTVTVPMSWSKTGVGIGKVWERGALDVSGSMNVQGVGAFINMFSEDTSGHGYITWNKSDGTRVAYAGISSASSKDLNLHNEQGGNILLQGSMLKFNNDDVVAQGETAQGHWVKLYDGTAMTYQRVMWNPNNGSMYAQIPYSYPNSNFITLVGGWNNDLYSLEEASSLTGGRNNNYQVRIVRNGAKARADLTFDISIGVFTIGRWK